MVERTRKARSPRSVNERYRLQRGGGKVLAQEAVLLFTHTAKSCAGGPRHSIVHIALGSFPHLYCNNAFASPLAWDRRSAGNQNL